ncbi:MAG TPA: hemerythrin domain-containing protein [Gaiellaceae bacterium]|nr:hemerythrin domain-containing protein [Gaiellaceae bacterium]
MKRHPALVHLSHDHHHALVQARKLKRAASDPDRAAAASAFATFFADVTVSHFREEEESLFPLAAWSEEARPLVVQALLDHQRLHALVAQLDRPEERGSTMVELADLLEQHVRREERELFPLLERIAVDALDDWKADHANGPVWGLASEDLNATLLAWRPGGGTEAHVNDERDVLIFVVDGEATVSIEGERHELGAGRALIVDKGLRRSVTAGPGGVRYLSVHLRRPPLQIKPLGEGTA